MQSEELDSRSSSCSSATGSPASGRLPAAAGWPYSLPADRLGAGMGGRSAAAGASGRPLMGSQPAAWGLGQPGSNGLLLGRSPRASAADQRISAPVGSETSVGARRGLNFGANSEAQGSDAQRPEVASSAAEGEERHSGAAYATTSSPTDPAAEAQEAGSGPRSQSSEEPCDPVPPAAGDTAEGAAPPEAVRSYRLEDRDLGSLLDGGTGGDEDLPHGAYGVSTAHQTSCNVQGYGLQYGEPCQCLIVLARKQIAHSVAVLQGLESKVAWHTSLHMFASACHRSRLQ